MKKKLKLYVWNNAFRDYTAGVMFALASSPEEARNLILKRCKYVPECVEKPEGFVIWGGG